MLSALARAAGSSATRVAWRQVNSGINKKQAPVRTHISQFLGNLAMFPLNPQNRQYSKNSETVNFVSIQRFFAEFNSLWESIEVNRQIHSILDPNRDVDLNEFNNKKDKILKTVNTVKGFFDENTDLKLNKTKKNELLLKVLDFQFTIVPKMVKELDLKNDSLFQHKDLLKFYLNLWTLDLPEDLTNIIDIYKSSMDKIHRDMLQSKIPQSLGFLLRNIGLMKWMVVHLESVTSLELIYLRECHLDNPEIIRDINLSIKSAAYICAAAVYTSVGPEDTTDRLGDPESAQQMKKYLNLDSKNNVSASTLEIICKSFPVSLSPLFDYTIKSVDILRKLITDFFTDVHLKNKAIKLVSDTLVIKSDNHVSTDRITPSQSVSNYEAGLSTMMIDFFYSFFELVTHQTVIALEEKYKIKLDYDGTIFKDASYTHLKRKNCELSRLSNDLAGYLREGRDEVNPLGNEVWRIVDQHVCEAMQNNLSPYQNNTAQVAIDTAYNIVKSEFPNSFFGFDNPNSVQLLLRVSLELRQKLNVVFLDAASKKFINDPQICRDIKKLNAIKDTIQINCIDSSLKREIIRLTSIEQMMQRYIENLLVNSGAVTKCIDKSRRIIAESGFFSRRLATLPRKNSVAWEKAIQNHEYAWSNLFITFLLTEEKDGGK
jgi:hypothetical protein